MALRWLQHTLWGNKVAIVPSVKVFSSVLRVLAFFPVLFAASLVFACHLFLRILMMTDVEETKCSQSIRVNHSALRVRKAGVNLPG